MSISTARCLPAYGRQVRDRLNAGEIPELGGGSIAVCIGWPTRCVLAHVVCIRDERPADGWDFDFLAGVEAIVWFDRRDGSYAQDVRHHLLRVGCPVVAMLQLPERDQ